jgi:CheY-like chemotaxis protein/nitrogen-specific signal transduction histidine kinase
MLVAMFLFGREVARRERVEAERDALLASERAARSEAERANRLKDEFVGILSHELRTPLAAILSWCDVLRLKRDGSETERAVDAVERNARAQARLVDDLLDVTRMQAGTLHLERAVVRLDAPVRAAIHAVTPAAEAKGVTIALATDGEPLVDGDAGRLQQVATNLLVNAVKFTPRGGRIEVTVRFVAGRAELVVADTGEGIDASFLPHLFTPFRQADSSAARRHGGLGLGLSIVASLIRLHQGEVRATSDGPGKGATFRVTLPTTARLAREAAPATSEPHLEGERAARPLASVRVLLVDDEEDVRTAVTQLLTLAGASVVALDSGTDVAGALAADRPHVLLIDIGMPGEDGYSLIRRIRKLPAEAGGRTPAVSLTAHARGEDRVRALASGFQDHLPKPIDLPLLVETVRLLAAEADRDAASAPGSEERPSGPT